jgi:hypothetical protein
MIEIISRTTAIRYPGCCPAAPRCAATRAVDVLVPAEERELGVEGPNFMIWNMPPLLRAPCRNRAY